MVAPTLTGIEAAEPAVNWPPGWGWFPGSIQAVVNRASRTPSYQCGCGGSGKQDVMAKRGRPSMCDNPIIPVSYLIRPHQMPCTGI